jgi:hypothetical protein
MENVFPDDYRNLDLAMKTHHITVLLIILFFFAAAASGLLHHHTEFFPKMLSLVKCPFLSLTGYPCATCGITRGMLLLGQGRLREAFFMSPLVVIFSLFLFIILIEKILFMAGAKNIRLLPLSKIRPQFAAVMVLALLLLSWIYNIAVFMAGK